MARGRFISVEGGEGAGKSTNIDGVRARPLAPIPVASDGRDADSTGTGSGRRSLSYLNQTEGKVGEQCIRHWGNAVNADSA